MASEEDDRESGLKSVLDRRLAMKRAGQGIVSAAALAALATGGVATMSNPAAAAPAPANDVDILTFALNLEYLEAEFYLRAIGQRLGAADVSGTGTQGTVTGGTPVPFKSPAIQQYAQRIAIDEQAHVRFLRAVFQAAGITPVAEPTIDVSASGAFTTLAVAAKLIVPGQTFNPYADDISFLLGASVFEDVGVTAYAGAARFLSNPNYIEAAAGILAVEAYHAGAIRTLLANIGAGVAFGMISALRATLSGKPDDIGILVSANNYTNNYNFVPTDVNGLAFRRNTNQVLNIVYGNTTATSGAATPGLFFPNGLNGTVR